MSYVKTSKDRKVIWVFYIEHNQIVTPQTVDETIVWARGAISQVRYFTRTWSKYERARKGA